MRLRDAMDIGPAGPGSMKRYVLRVPDNVRMAHGADGATALDIVRGKMFRVNTVGSRILELLKQGLAEPGIAEQLAHEFGIERITVEADMREFVESLEKHQLLTSRNSSSLT